MPALFGASLPYEGNTILHASSSPSLYQGGRFRFARDSCLCRPARRLSQPSEAPKCEVRHPLDRGDRPVGLQLLVRAQGAHGSERYLRRGHNPQRGLGRAGAHVREEQGRDFYSGRFRRLDDGTPAPGAVLQRCVFCYHQFGDAVQY